jgi:endonuclease/exonuclease/phosphatase family metal-dependent hydrolase
VTPRHPGRVVPDRHSPRRCRVIPAALWLLALLAGCTAASPGPATAPATQPPNAPVPIELTVVTFNIRYAAANDGVNSWPNRRALLVRTIRTHDPDLFGCQEVLDSQAQFLRENFPEYGFLGTGRDDGATRGEYSPILYRQSRFELLRHGQFWLSPTPEQVGSRGWDAALPRICTWAQLRLREGPVLWVFNSHWDHRGQTARTEAGRLIRHRAAAMAGRDPVVIIGDFNIPEDGAGYRALLEPGTDGLSLRDAYRLVHPIPSPDEATLHDFTGNRQGRRIDHILISPHWSALSAIIDDAHEGRVYPSDHFPVVTRLAVTPL